MLRRKPGKLSLILTVLVLVSVGAFIVLYKLNQNDHSYRRITVNTSDFSYSIIFDGNPDNIEDQGLGLAGYTPDQEKRILVDVYAIGKPGTCTDVGLELLFNAHTKYGDYPVCELKLKHLLHYYLYFNVDSQWYALDIGSPGIQSVSADLELAPYQVDYSQETIRTITESIEIL